MKRFVLFWIRAYQAGLSPLLPASCRFTPTCSEYARQAVEMHGAARGCWLALKRIGRCHPLGGQGHDPVPGGEGDPGESSWTAGNTLPDRG
ncbi:MAG: membrane protein insertion efficiency factor YidD [marine benthic group bacterium]|nr:membrane protein insertion efficiency factor YidD [Candidatus Benthicola marisminoris]